MGLGFSSSFIAISFAGIATLGILIWWLERRRQKRLLLPIVRVLDLNSRKFPRVMIRLPPLLSFLCFLVMAIFILLTSFRPVVPISNEAGIKGVRSHILVDLSPSVSRYIGADELKSLTEDIFTSLKEAGRVTLSTTGSADIYEGIDIGLAYAFHREGARLGEVLNQINKDLGDVDRLVIISDRDSHSWGGFNWQFLSDRTEVMRVDVSDGVPTKNNIYVQDVFYPEGGAPQLQPFDVELRQDFAEEDYAGLLTVHQNGKELDRVQVKMSKGQKALTVRVNLTKAQISSQKGQKEQPLEFRIEKTLVDGIELDNQFLSGAGNPVKSAVLVSPVESEHGLLDGTAPLVAALKVHHFEVLRLDSSRNMGKRGDHRDLYVFAGGGCNGATSLKNAVIWLVPPHRGESYPDLCRCYRAMAGISLPSSHDYCDEATSRERYLAVLEAVGAKQIGGSLGGHKDALAMRGLNRQSHLDIFALSIPLSPKPEQGISYAAIPLMMSGLLEVGGLKANQGPRAWPRISDLSNLWQERKHAHEHIASNVPAVESKYAPQSMQELPIVFNSRGGVKELSRLARYDEQDALVWLVPVFYLILFLTALEGIWGIIDVRRKRSAKVVAVLFAIILFAPNIKAQVSINLLGYEHSEFSTLAKEVSQRTSIELNSTPLNNAKFGSAALQEPWLWISDLSLIVKNGSLDPLVKTWIGRGGVIIVENYRDHEDLTRFFTQFFGSQWQAIPPDHEFMRSFYLLDSLPSCQNKGWKGMQFDGRLAAIAMPFSLINQLKDSASARQECLAAVSGERLVRIFVNLVMVSLATDYKKDQVHLPEILKRLR